MDDIERAAIVDEGFDPDDPAVIAALTQVKETLRRYRARPSKLESVHSDVSVGE